MNSPNAQEGPKQLGDFEIVRELGRSGMGVVYEARQESPERRVAIKVLRADHTSKASLRRFEQEAQVLGRLKHPGIARVYEAGSVTDEMGRRPYITMELIEGSRLTDHARDASMPVAQRLELLARVCDALEYAHRKGVVHRDLKPGNILVVEDTTERPDLKSAKKGHRAPVGRPMVLDFGVAMVGGDLTVSTILTGAGQLLGTLPYMSPEQVAGGDVDARSDVYALGVIGFELLAGRTPHDLRGKIAPEAARIIREEEPASLASTGRGFPSDVDTIFRKSLEKDPARRYQSACDLAADIRRWLAGEPISARPASAAYLLGKLVRRHRGLATGVAVALASLLLATVFSTVSAINAARQRDRAIAAEVQAERIRQFLQNILAKASPNSTRHDLTVREVLDDAASRVESELTGVRTSKPRSAPRSGRRMSASDCTTRRRGTCGWRSRFRKTQRAGWQPCAR